MKMMEVKPALALPEGLELVGLERRNNLLTVTVVSTQASPRCLLCEMVSERVHSRYMRQVNDLPCGGQPVNLLIVWEDFRTLRGRFGLFHDAPSRGKSLTMCQFSPTQRAN